MIKIQSLIEAMILISDRIFEGRASAMQIVTNVHL